MTSSTPGVLALHQGAHALAFQLEQPRVSPAAAYLRAGSRDYSAGPPGPGQPGGLPAGLPSNPAPPADPSFNRPNGLHSVLVPLGTDVPAAGRKKGDQLVEGKKGVMRRPPGYTEVWRTRPSSWAARANQRRQGGRAAWAASWGVLFAVWRPGGHGKAPGDRGRPPSPLGNPRARPASRRAAPGGQSVL